MSAEEVVIPVPDVPDFCLNTPLYTSFTFNQSDFTKLQDIEFYKKHLDCFCLECNQPSVFNPQPKPTLSRSPDFYATRQNIIVERHFFCSRDDAHELNFYFRFHNGTVTKIGQNPSIADLSTYNIRKYTRLLGKQRYAEFSRAIGLISHGVGIGSFVYLRRIIEQLIEEAHRTRMSSDGWDEDLYERARMDEKIKMLEDMLPQFLVTNRSIYAILSKGIHELTEQECLDSYNVIRVGIELILDEKLKELERMDKIKLAEKDIARLTNKIKRPK